MSGRNKLKVYADGRTVVWWCQGCGCAHSIKVADGAPWTWNGDVDKPTFSPSVLSTGEKRCHCFITDGNIRFLQDCGHGLAGKTVPMEEWPFSDAY